MFWLTVVLFIVTTVLSLYSSYHQVSPQLKEYRDTIRQMEADGESEDKINRFMDKDTEIDENRLIESPLWLVLLVTIGIIASFVLLVIGILGKM